MDFFINTGFFTKTFENKALAIRKKHQKFVSRLLVLVKKAEPVLWEEMIMLIQYRLSSKITPTI